MFGLGEEKNYATIVAPLKQMVTNLSDYIEEKKNQISNYRDDIVMLEKKKEEFEDEILESQSEINKSNHTTGKINDLLGLDLDDDGIADVNELPEEDDTTPPDDDTTPKVE